MTNTNAIPAVLAKKQILAQMSLDTAIRSERYIRAWELDAVKSEIEGGEHIEIIYSVNRFEAVMPAGSVLCANRDPARVEEWLISKGFRGVYANATFHALAQAFKANPDFCPDPTWWKQHARNEVRM